MLPWFAEHVVMLGRDRLSLVSTSRFTPKRVGFQLESPVQPGNTSSAKEALSSVLRRLPRRYRGGRILILLSSAWAVHLTLPWQAGLHLKEEWENYARALMATEFGGETVAWRLRVYDAPRGRPRMACAIDEMFYRDLADTVTDAGMRLTRIEPALANVYSRYRRELNGPDFALMVMEDAQVTCAFAHGSAWDGITILPGSGHHDLARSVNQAAALLHCVPPERVYFAASARGPLPDAVVGAQWLGRVHPLIGA